MFLRSCLTETNPFISTDGILEWVEQRRKSIAVRVERTRFEQLDKWLFDQERGNLRHESGRFFSIDGIRVRANWGDVPEWTQPIINQPEVGYLGIVAREIDGILYFLMQAKIEPGNIQKVQIAPTLQATKSNYTMVHKGKGQAFLSYFLDRERNRVLLDQLQSEQGARFLKKRNRNIILLVDQAVPHDENYQWMTIGQIKRLLQTNNLVNMDTRTVLSGIPLGDYETEVENLPAILESLQCDSGHHGRAMLASMFDTRRALHSFDDLLSWFTDRKQRYELEVETIPLADLDLWRLTPEAIVHAEDKYFRVVPVDVSIEGREVQSWSQPMVEPRQEGLIAFIIKEINGTYHFLVQAKPECGNFDVIEMAPTVQCLTGPPTGAVPFLDYVVAADGSRVRYDKRLSEEGGRFYHEQNRNMIVEADEDFPDELPNNYCWMTLGQLSIFLKFNNYLNIQTRSLLSTILFN